MLGHEPSGDERREAGGVRAARMGDRSVPSGAQAVLWGGRAQVRKAVSILRHLLLALRAFLRLEVYRLRRGVSWYEAKASIVREARSYLAHPSTSFSQLRKS
jgi:hypothetical protein